MTTEKFTEPSPRRTVFATTLARLMREPQIDGLRGIRLLHRFAGRRAMPPPDPVSWRCWRSIAWARRQCGPAPRVSKFA